MGKPRCGSKNVTFRSSSYCWSRSATRWWGRCLGLFTLGQAGVPAMTVRGMQDQTIWPQSRSRG